LRFEPLEPRRVLDAGPLAISEFMAINDGGLEDADKEPSDWIEIHNPTDEPVALEGWSLTDDPSDLDKWEFPARPLPAGGYLVVFASAKDRAGTTGELHTNFKLDGDGEYLALVQPDGQTIAHAYAPSFPDQSPNVSYGMTDQTSSFLVPDEAQLRYTVPTQNVGDWMQPEYDDSSWLGFTQASNVLITELGTADPDYIEIQNVAARSVDTSGWAVAANIGTRGDVNSVHTFEWELPALMPGGQILYRTDDPADGADYWGEEIMWRTAGYGWVMIVDDVGNIADFIAWGYSAAHLSELDTTVNGHQVTLGDAFLGEPPPPGSAALSLQRHGVADHDDASDWSFTSPTSLDRVNAGLTTPFATEVATGVGFDVGSGELAAAVQIDVAAQMHGVNPSLWLRVPFTVDNPATFDSLHLQMQYNDGFVAYLNGREVARHNVPDTPHFDSAALEARDAQDSLTPVEFDVTPFLSELSEGTNVLAVHGLNAAADDANFLIVPDLARSGDEYFDVPTPWAANSTGFARFVADTKFSVDRGFYEQPFEVEITTETAGATIFYTLDGSEPTESNGTPYLGPIPVATTTTLRAAAFKGDYLPSNVDTQTYLFLDDVIRQPNNPPGYPSTWAGRPADYEMDPEVVGPNNVFDDAYRDTIIDDLKALPSLSVVMDVDDLFGSNGIYVKPQSTGFAYERPTSAEWISPDGSEDGFQINCGIRVQGGASRSPDFPKHSMRLEFRSQYGPGRLEYPLFDNLPYGRSPTDSFDEIVLRTSFNNSWPHWHYDQAPRAQYIRDQWVRDMQFEMGHMSTHGRYAHLYINGMYWGVYNIGERPAAPFQATYYGGDEDDYDVINSGSAIDGSGSGWSALMSLANAGLSTPQQYAKVQEYIDLDNLIDYMLLNFYVGNNDWDGHNWISARRNSPDSPFLLFAWDSEFAIATTPSQMQIGETGNQMILNVNKTNVNGNNKPSRVYNKLRQNEEFRLRFADRVQKHMFNGGVLTPARSTEMWDVRTAEVYDAVVAESARWGDYRRDVHSNRWNHSQFDLLNRDEHYVAQQQFIRERYLPSRTNTVLGQLRAGNLYPDVDAPQYRVSGTRQHGGGIETTDQLTITDAPGTIYYTLDGSDPRLTGGAVHGTAYTGPISITEDVVVKARARDGGKWSALSEARFLIHTPAAAENLAIGEINYNPFDPTVAELATQPPEDDDFEPGDFEFIELLNTTADTVVNLADAHFTAGVEFSFNDGTATLLEPGGRAVLVANLAAFEARYGAQVNVAGQFTGSLDNGGERMVLEDWWGETIFDFRFGDGNRWPGRADGKGATLQLREPPNTLPDDYGNSETWQSSVQFGGTPGAPPAEATGVVVNEVLTHSDAPLVDAIELKNTTAEAIDVGGWYLSDSWGWSSSDRNGDYRKFRIPDGTVVPAGGYVAFYEGHDVGGQIEFDPATEFGGAGDGDFALSGAKGDDVWLMEADAAGNLTRFADHVEFPTAAAGETFGRWPDATGDLYPMLQRTLGGPNSAGRIGPLSIGEVMYHPAEGGGPADEFIELVNTSGSTVKLFDPLRPANTWRIAGLGFSFPRGVEVPSGGAVLVVPIEPDAFRSRYDVPADVQIFGPYAGSLDNSGENVRLLRPDEPTGESTVPWITVDRVDYRRDEGWPTEADGTGASLHRAAIGTGGTYAESWAAAEPTPGDASNLVSTRIVGRHVFYNRSSFDGNDAAATAADDAAIAVDKTPLLPGSVATQANYTNYSLGINGVMVDVAGLAPDFDPALGDFRFRVGNSNTPADWAGAPPPTSLTLRAAAGIDGSDRITLVWPDHAVKQQWLEVTVLGANLGLPADDVFYFGNAVAEAGNSPSDAQVTTTDLLLARNNPRNFLNPAAVDFAFDYNRDQRVGTTDVLLARNNQTNFLTQLRLIEPAVDALFGEA